MNVANRNNRFRVCNRMLADKNPDTVTLKLCAPVDRSVTRRSLDGSAVAVLRRLWSLRPESERLLRGTRPSRDDERPAIDERAIREWATYLCIDSRRYLSSSRIETFDMIVDHVCPACPLLVLDHVVRQPLFSAIIPQCNWLRQPQ
jgi:hypothetical protein